jgi:hypothetical protein
MFFWLRSRGEACQKKNTWHLATPSYMVAFEYFSNTEQKPTQGCGSSCHVLVLFFFWQASPRERSQKKKKTFAAWQLAVAM